MSINSNQKGKTGEREIANILKGYGYGCRRSQQYCGANNDADVIGLPGIHLECKRVEKLNLYNAMSQAISETKEGEKPSVFHRRNRCEWLVTMRLKDWIEIYREWEAGRNGGSETGTKEG